VSLGFDGCVCGVRCLGGGVDCYGDWVGLLVVFLCGVGLVGGELGGALGG